MVQERNDTHPGAGASASGQIATNGSNGSKNPFDKRLVESLEEYGLDSEVYEEPDRDTDSSASFYETSIEDQDDYDDVGRDAGSAPTPPPRGYASAQGNDEGLDELDDEIDPLADDWEDDMTTEEESEAWLDDRGFPDEPESSQAWPLGLIAVAVVALVLLIAGGYGVMQQRASTQEEIRELRAALATAASPEEVAESRNAAAEAEQRNIQLKEQLYTLSAENRRLSDTVSGLETQMAVQQKAIAEAMEKAKNKPTAASPAVAAARRAVATPKTAPKPASAATPTRAPAAQSASAAAPLAGTWFVNFGSYGSTEVAEEWVKKLKPAAGRVITAPGEKNGRTFYRVRVVDLPDKPAAENVARILERDYNLSRLWIGKQS